MSAQTESGSKLDQIQIEPLQTVSLPEALDAEGLAWFTGPEGYGWWGQISVAADGIDAAHSTTRFNRGHSYVQTVVDGPGVITFDWKVSTRPTESTYYFFYLAEYWPGEEMLEWNRKAMVYEEYWQTQTVTIPPGRHVATWKVDQWDNRQYAPYSGYLDNVSYAPTATEYAFRASLERDGWMLSPWFGWYSDDHYPWIYTYGHGWQYTNGTHDQSVTLYDAAIGEWLWTGEGSYPFVYRFDDDEWYYISPGSEPGGRWFSRLSDGVWIKEQDL